MLREGERRRSSTLLSPPRELAHRPGSSARRQLGGVDRTGRVTGVLKAPDDALLATPQLAPDERRVAVSRAVQGNFDVWLVEVGRAFDTRFTFDPAVDAGDQMSCGKSGVFFVGPRGFGALSRASAPLSGWITLRRECRVPPMASRTWRRRRRARLMGNPT